VRQEALVDSEEYIRAWAVQFATADSNPRNSVAELTDLAQNDASPVVRLYLASALQRLALEDRFKVVSGLVAHAEDAEDRYLPLMIWYGVEPLAGRNESLALSLLEKAKIPLVRRFIAERLALRLAMNGLTQSLGNSDDAQFQADVVLGMYLALNGRRQLSEPEGWASVAGKLEKHPSKEVQDQALRISLTFGNETALREIEHRAADKSLAGSERKGALEALGSIRRPELVALLQKSLTDPALRRTAMNELAAYENSETPNLIISQYARLNPEEKSEAINTLSSRVSFAIPLLEAVRDKKIPARDITPFSARQMQAYKDPRLEPLLKELGTVRGVSGEKAAQVERYKKLLTSAALGQADLQHGRAMFKRTCASCHTLFDDGGKLAPELTGSQRGNLDYILENVIDPNAVVWDRYKATYFETSDDRLISGIVTLENESTVTIQTQTGTVTLPRNDIVKKTQSNLSMMPEGLLDALSEGEIIDLVGYLQSPKQVPLPVQ